MIQPKSSGSELTRKFSRHDNAAYVTVVSQLIYTTILERRIGRDLSIIHTERLTVVGRGEMKFYASFGFQGKNSCLPTHRIISASRINDSFPGRRLRKLCRYLKLFSCRLGANYKVEEECNDCQQKAAMGKHFVKHIFIYIDICLLSCLKECSHILSHLYMYCIYICRSIYMDYKWFVPFPFV